MLGSIGRYSRKTWREFDRSLPNQKPTTSFRLPIHFIQALANLCVFRAVRIDRYHRWAHKHRTCLFLHWLAIPAKSAASRYVINSSPQEICKPLTRMQCDETQPICQRCSKSKRQCSGVRSNNDSIVHIENDFASGSRKRPRGPRRRSPAPLSIKLVVDLKAQAILYYLHNHVQPLHDAPSISKSVEDDIETIYKSRPNCPTTQLAISVIALVLFGKTQNQPQAIVDACVGYQKLLQDIQNSISSPENCDIEACLLAIFCMGRYEDTVHSIEQPITPMWALRSASHHDGALAVLKAFRNRKGSTMQNIPDIVKHTRRGMIKSAIMRNRNLPDWILEGKDFGEEGLELENDGLLIKLVDLRQRLCSLRDDQEKGTYEIAQEAAEIAKKAQALDLEMCSWPTHFPSTWLRKEHILPPKFGVRDSPRKVYSYQSFAYASIWTKHYAARILVNTLLIQSLHLAYPSRPTSQTKEQISMAHANLTEMAKEFQCSLPFCFGNLEGTVKEEDMHPITIRWVAWPLTMVMFADELEEGLKTFFMDAIVSLGKRVGIGALEKAEDILRGGARRR